jgi:hypothetical protein
LTFRRLRVGFSEALVGVADPGHLKGFINRSAVIGVPPYMRARFWVGSGVGATFSFSRTAILQSTVRMVQLMTSETSNVHYGWLLSGLVATYSRRGIVLVLSEE